MELPKIPISEQALIDLYGVNPATLSSADKIHEIFDRLLRMDLGLNIVFGPKTHPFHPAYQSGVTSMAILAESHASISTWPEIEFASLDVQTCSVEPKLIEIARYCILSFDPKNITVTQLNFTQGYPEVGRRTEYRRERVNDYSFKEIMFLKGIERVQRGYYTPSQNRTHSISNGTPLFV